MIVALWTVIALLAAVLACLILLRVGALLIQPPPEESWDPFAVTIAESWHPSNTRTGRVRLMLAAMAHREADGHGVPREQQGLHRATP